MIYVLINALPILLAAVAGTAMLVAVWRTRMKATGRTAVPVALFAASLVLSAILAGALILAPVNAGRWTIALGSAFIIWGGFVLPGVAATLLSRGTGWRGAFGDAAAWLALMLLQAAVLQLIGVVHP